MVEEQEHGEEQGQGERPDEGGPEQGALGAAAVPPPPLEHGGRAGAGRAADGVSSAISAVPWSSLSGSSPSSALQSFCEIKHRFTKCSLSQRLRVLMRPGQLGAEEL